MNSLHHRNFNGRQLGALAPDKTVILINLSFNPILIRSISLPHFLSSGPSAFPSFGSFLFFSPLSIVNTPHTLWLCGIQTYLSQPRRQLEVPESTRAFSPEGTSNKEADTDIKRSFRTALCTQYTYSKDVYDSECRRKYYLCLCLLFQIFCTDNIISVSRARFVVFVVFSISVPATRYISLLAGM